MYTCPLCHQQFAGNNQVHACSHSELDYFLQGKSVHTVALFQHFTDCYCSLGTITVHPLKSMIAFAARKRIAYVIRLGKDFADIVFAFKKPYNDNLCFRKIAQVPGQQQFNHHFRMCYPEDVNDEVLYFMKLAYEEGL